MHSLDEIREILTRHSAGGQGQRETAVPRLGIFRADQPSTPTPGVYEPMVCLVVAGRKRGFLRNETYEYSEGDALLITVDLPVVGTILEASPERPYLALSLRLHRSTLASVVLEAEPLASTQRDERHGTRVHRADPALLDAALRMARLLDRPNEVPVLAPLIEREIHFRLLASSFGPSVLEISRSGSRTSQIRRAVEWLRDNYADDYRAERLAEIAAMSVSSLNRHFRAVTAMSPLEYQKRIRLQEARRMLLASHGDVAGVGYEVGYRSVSQFTREYRRLFGQPPGRDVERLRGVGSSPSPARSRGSSATG